MFGGVAKRDPTARPDHSSDTLTSSHPVEIEGAVEPLARTAFGAAPPFISRFELGRRLGSGGFGEVYEARDRSNGGMVALKILRRRDPTSLLQFKREFRRVAQLVHPNLVRLYELIEEGEQWFFTMELLVGRHALDYLRARPIDQREAAIRRSFSQLATAIEVLHGAGIVHRDIKPSNVMVTDDGRVVLLDFGVAKQMLTTDLQSTSALVGTPAYFAPERLQRTGARESSDWYSVGVMLYQALTNSLPFEGEWLETMIARVENDPVPPRRLAREVPADLSDLCMALLARKPERRPGAAEIRARLNAPDVVTTSKSARVTSATPGPALLVARTAQLDVIRGAVEHVKRGVAAAVHVSGASGIGKTTLVQRCLSELRHDDTSVVILTSACHQQESVAFNALDEFVDRLTEHLEHLPPGPPLVLPAQSALIGRLFPVFQRVSGASAATSQPEVSDPIEIRRQAFAALRTLLVRLSERSLVVVAIDDLQWADRDSGSFLAELLRSPDAPPLLLILSYRSQPPGINPLIDQLREAHATSGAIKWQTVELSELSTTETESLLRDLLGNVQEELDTGELARLAVEADGNPFLVHRLAQRILATPDHAAAAGRATVISEEIDRLSPVHRRLIELVAVAGQPLPMDVAVKAAIETSGGSVDFGSLFAAHLLQLHRRGLEESVDIYHDRIRKEIVESLTAEAKAAHHQTLIDALSSVRPDESERLAYHCELSGQLNEASAHSLAAARLASRALAFDKAVSLYRRALELGAWSPDQRQPIQLDLARALVNAGRGPEAAREFLLAAKTVTGIAGVRLRIIAADQYLRAGHLKEGQDLLRRLLDEVGLRWTDRPSLMIASMLVNRARAHALMRHLDRDPVVAVDEREVARMEVLWAAAVGLSMFDPVRSAEFSARHLVFALKYRDPYRVALSLAGEATQMAHRDGGRDGRPRTMLQTAMRYARRSGEPHAVAFVHCMAGIVAFLGGRWSESAIESERALTLLRQHCIGVSWDVATAASFMCASQVFRGRLAEHARLLPMLVADARARGDIYAADVLPAISLSWIQQLIADQPEAASTELPSSIGAAPGGRWRIHDTNAVAARTDIAAYRGDARAAWTIVSDSWPSVTRSLLNRVITIRILFLNTRGRCAVALAATLEGGAAERTRLLREAAVAATAMERTRCDWAVALATAIRAGIASCRGDLEGAEQLLQRAAADCQACDLMPWHYAARLHLASCRGRAGNDAPPLDEWWISERIVKPNQVATFLIPGIWPSKPS